VQKRGHARDVPLVRRVVEKSGGAIVVVEKPAESLATTNATGVPRRHRVDKFVAEPLVVPLVVVQVDNPTPIILSREKSVIRGIHGSVVQSPYTRYLSKEGSSCVGAVSRRSGIVEP
jgi:hypothetical protein